MQKNYTIIDREFDSIFISLGLLWLLIDHTAVELFPLVLFLEILITKIALRHWAIGFNQNSIKSV